MAEVRMRQILWATALTGALTATAPAASQADEARRTASIAPETAQAQIDVGYELRFWFIPFGHTSYHGVFVDGTYQASSHFKTSGLVSVFWQAEIDAGASGTIEAHRVVPYIYDSFARRSAEKVQRVKLTYTGDGPPRLFAKPAYNTKRYPVSAAEQEAGVDPMSAITLILTGLSAGKDNPCGTMAPVFDGRRRYNVELTYLKDETVRLDDRLYAGPAHLCRIRYHEIAGYKQDILKKGSGWPAIYALIADVPDKAAPLGRYTVPLKLWADTHFGTVSAEITTLQTGGGEGSG